MKSIVRGALIVSAMFVVSACDAPRASSSGASQKPGVATEADNAKLKLEQQRDDAAKAALKKWETPLEAVKEVASSKWRYEDEVDQMSGKPIGIARVTSENILNFDPPYSGDTYSFLMIRKTGKRNDVMFSVSNGQIVCMMRCRISVRFDDRAPITFDAAPPSDYSAKAVFLSPEAKFVSELKRSKKVRVEVTYYSSGARISEFDTANFAPSKG